MNYKYWPSDGPEPDLHLEPDPEMWKPPDLLLCNNLTTGWQRNLDNIPYIEFFMPDIVNLAVTSEESDVMEVVTTRLIIIK